MAQVYRIMVRCPATRKVLDTGIRTSGRESLTNNAYRDGMIACRHCPQFHSLDEAAFWELESEAITASLWRPNP